MSGGADKFDVTWVHSPEIVKHFMEKYKLDEKTAYDIVVEVNDKANKMFKKWHDNFQKRANIRIRKETKRLQREIARVRLSERLEYNEEHDIL